MIKTSRLSILSNSSMHNLIKPQPRFQSQLQRQLQMNSRSITTITSSTPTSTSTRPLTRPNLLRSFSSTSINNSFHFDTHALLTRLEASGMPRQQADSLVAAMADVIDESVNGLSKNLVSREQGERWRYTQKVSRSRESNKIEYSIFWKSSKMNCFVKWERGEGTIGRVQYSKPCGIQQRLDSNGVHFSRVNKVYYFGCIP